ncbi:hypothetical protein [Rhizobium leguminosarum]|nr:hypothetical protein [Rhizobium leguminosarum]
MAPARDISFIYEDDFSGLELTGAAVETSKSIGIWRDLKKGSLAPST